MFTFKSILGTGSPSNPRVSGPMIPEPTSWRTSVPFHANPSTEISIWTKWMRLERPRFCTSLRILKITFSWLIYLRLTILWGCHKTQLNHLPSEHTCLCPSPKMASKNARVESPVAWSLQIKDFYDDVIDPTPKRCVGGQGHSLLRLSLNGTMLGSKYWVVMIRPAFGGADTCLVPRDFIQEKCKSKTRAVCVFLAIF